MTDKKKKTPATIHEFKKGDTVSVLGLKGEQGKITDLLPKTASAVVMAANTTTIYKLTELTIITEDETPATEQPVADDQPTEDQDDIVEESTPPTPAEAIQLLDDIKTFYEINIGKSQQGYNDNVDKVFLAIDLASSALIGDLHQVKELTRANTKLTEEVERQRTLVMVANRQTVAAKVEAVAEAAKAQTQRPLEPGELVALQTESKRLTEEIARLTEEQQRPQVETIQLTREIATDAGCEPDPELSGYIAQGWNEVPALCDIFEVDGVKLMQLVTLRRTNQPPHYTGRLMTEIGQAFDAQADRNESILQPSPTPYTDLVRDGHSSESIIDASDAKALKDARTTFNTSPASRSPVTMSQAVNQLTEMVSAKG